MVRFDEIPAFAGMTECNFGILTGPSPTGWVQKDHDHNSGQSNPITRIPSYSGHDYHGRPGVLLSHRHGHRRRRADVRRNRSLENVTRGVCFTMCDIDSEYYGTFGAYGVSAGQFIWPSTCTLDSRDRVYVSDEQLHRISVFEREGALLSIWGEHGAGEGQLDTPSGLAFDSDDNLYVADAYNRRVQKFTTEGCFLASLGREGTGPAELNLPWGRSWALTAECTWRTGATTASRRFRGTGNTWRPTAAAVEAMASSAGRPASPSMLPVTSTSPITCIASIPSIPRLIEY